MKNVFLLIAIVLLSLNVFSQSGNAWGKLSWGMTKPEITTLYPGFTKAIYYGGNMRATGKDLFGIEFPISVVHFIFDSNRLSGIEMFHYQPYLAMRDLLVFYGPYDSMIYNISKDGQYNAYEYVWCNIKDTLISLEVDVDTFNRFSRLGSQAHLKEGDIMLSDPNPTIIRFIKKSNIFWLE